MQAKFKVPSLKMENVRYFLGLFFTMNNYLCRRQGALKKNLHRRAKVSVLITGKI